MKKSELKEVIRDLFEEVKKCMKEEDSDYQEFFRKALEKFGVKSPKELSSDKEKEFYNYIDKTWNAKKETDVDEAKISPEERRLEMWNKKLDKKMAAKKQWEDKLKNSNNKSKKEKDQIKSYIEMEQEDIDNLKDKISRIKKEGKNMKKSELKSLIRECIEELNENAYKDLKKLEDANWEADYDSGAGHSSLINRNNDYVIFEPYNADKDEEGWFNGKNKMSFEVQVSNVQTGATKFFWFKDYKSALVGIKELKKKFNK